MIFNDFQGKSLFARDRNVQGTERNGFQHGIMERNGFLGMERILGTDRNGFLGTEPNTPNILPILPQYLPIPPNTAHIYIYICQRHGPGPMGPGPWAQAHASGIYMDGIGGIGGYWGGIGGILGVLGSVPRNPFRSVPRIRSVPFQEIRSVP